MDHARCWGGRGSDSDQTSALLYDGAGELELLMCLTSARKTVAMERSCRQSQTDAESDDPVGPMERAREDRTTAAGEDEQGAQ